MSLAENLLKLTKQLYPTGKAFKVPVFGWLEGLHIALAKSEAAVIDDSIFLLWSILPDNDNFTAADASQWEVRLGMIVNDSIDLEVRKMAIKRKMNHPSTIKARQHRLYLQKQLQDAGFDVYVHENIPEIDPLDFLLDDSYGQLGDDHEMGDGVELGDFFSAHSDMLYFIEMGEGELGDYELNEYFWINKVANCITKEEDLIFSNGTNYRRIFFIGGETAGTFADVNVEREAEFRQLILNVKPAQTVAYLLINYNYN